MGQVSAKLRSWTGTQGERGYAHWCPGCEEMHVIATEGPGPRWTFNGDLEVPTFGPSVKIDWDWGDPPKPECCHYFINGGQIQYCGDCTHGLNGQTVPLPDLPEGYRG